jgi:hypothetical protein
MWSLPDADVVSRSAQRATAHADTCPHTTSLSSRLLKNFKTKAGKEISKKSTILPPGRLPRDIARRSKRRRRCSRSTGSSMWPPRSIRSLRVRITTDTVPVLQFASSLSSLTLMKSALAAAASSSQSVTIRTLTVRLFVSSVCHDACEGLYECMRARLRRWT